MAAKIKDKGKDKDKDLKKGKADGGVPGGDDEEIIEKKPSAPVELTLMIITFVVLITGIYLNWGQLSDFYWDTELYNNQEDAMNVYTKFRTQNVQNIPAENIVVPDLGAAQPAQPGK